MQLLITGSPGTGKTTIAKMLAKRLKCKYINELDFSLKKGLGKWDHESGELVVPLSALKRELSKELAKEKDIIVEGHLLCETKLPVDYVVLLRVHPEILEERLRRKQYEELKVADNVFCEGIDYCKKHVSRRYAESKIIEIKNEGNINNTIKNILKELNLRGFHA